MHVIDDMQFGFIWGCDITNFIYYLSKLYKKFLHYPTESNKVKYKKYTNKLNHLLRIAKRFHYDSKF